MFSIFTLPHCHSSHHLDHIHQQHHHLDADCKMSRFLSLLWWSDDHCKMSRFLSLQDSFPSSGSLPALKHLAPKQKGGDDDDSGGLGDDGDDHDDEDDKDDSVMKLHLKGKMLRWRNSPRACVYILRYFASKSIDHHQKFCTNYQQQKCTTKYVRQQPVSGDLSTAPPKMQLFLWSQPRLWKSAFGRQISQVSLKNPTFFHPISDGTTF